MRLLRCTDPATQRWRRADWWKLRSMPAPQITSASSSWTCGTFGTPARLLPRSSQAAAASCKVEVEWRHGLHVCIGRASRSCARVWATVKTRFGSILQPVTALLIDVCRNIYCVICASNETTNIFTVGEFISGVKMFVAEKAPGNSLKPLYGPGNACICAKRRKSSI